jgi:hypothetical protein
MDDPLRIRVRFDHIPSQLAGRYQSRSDQFSGAPCVPETLQPVGKLCIRCGARIDRLAAVVLALHLQLETLDLDGRRRSTGFRSNHSQLDTVPGYFTFCPLDR